MIPTLSCFLISHLEYVWEYAWPRESSFISTQSLYEQFHAVPGLIAPVTKEVFQRTVKRGIESGQWVLKQGDETYHAKKQPTIIRIDESTELLTTEEADKRGILEEPPTAPPESKRGAGRRPTLIPYGVISLGFNPVESLAEGLITRMRRDKFRVVDEATMKIQGPIIKLLYIKNLFTRLAPDRTTNLLLQAEIRRSRSPKYSLSLTVSKWDMTKEEGSSLLDTAWRIKGAERCDTTLTLRWPEGAKPEDAARVIRSLGEGVSEPLIASLEAKVARK